MLPIKTTEPEKTTITEFLDIKFDQDDEEEKASPKIDQPNPSFQEAPIPTPDQQ